MANDKIILAFIGDLAAGKGTACAYLQKQYGFNSYRFSTVLRDVLRRIYVAETREHLQKLSTVLRENFGQDILSKTMIQDMTNDANAVVLVEGIRRESDIADLKNLPGFHLLYITADARVRHERSVKRNENPGDAAKTFDQFLRDEQAEADRTIKALGAQAEYVITNDADTDALYARLEEILNKIKNENKN